MHSDNGKHNNSIIQMKQVPTTFGGEKLSRQRPWQSKRPATKRRLLWRTLILLLLISLVFAAVHLGSVFSATNDQLLVRLSNQRTVTVDLRQSIPISPYLLGANAFPKINTSSKDQKYNGFMSYSSPVTTGLKNAHIKLLRFPGGTWGEEHLLSFDQLNEFSKLLSQTGAEGMIQARLSGPVGQNAQSLSELQNRAALAGDWVNYMNDPHSRFRTGPNAHAPFHHIKFWTVGNEPDLLLNPDTGKRFTATEYTNAFIAFSLHMHQNDPTIKVFGPEISQFYGLGAGPKDSEGQLWMETFLKGVQAYEKAHPDLKFRLLDGVSFHYYPINDAHASPRLLSTISEWNYLLPPLRQLIRQEFGRDIPVAVTEINSSPLKDVSSPGLAALWWANTLGTLMDQEAEYVAFFATEGVNTPYPLFHTKNQHETPMFRVMQLYSHLQHNLIPTETTDNSINLYATQDNTHNTVSLLFVNTSADIQSAQVSTQNQFLGLSNWRNLDIRLFAYSITAITLHRGGEAEAYSYRALLSTNNTNAVPLAYTVCGHQTDVLANEKPC